MEYCIVCLMCVCVCVCSSIHAIPNAINLCEIFDFHVHFCWHCRKATLSKSHFMQMFGVAWRALALYSQTMSTAHQHQAHTHTRTHTFISMLADKHYDVNEVRFEFEILARCASLYACVYCVIWTCTRVSNTGSAQTLLWTAFNIAKRSFNSCRRDAVHTSCAHRNVW